MKRTANRRAASYLAVTVTAVALLVIVAATVGRAAGPDRSPSVPPSATPGATPTPIVTPHPQPSGPTGGIFDVDLDIATPHDVSIVIKDESGAVTGASSGRAGDGMSVRWERVKLENLDDDTLRVTWVGLPVDASLGALVYQNEAGLGIVIIQPEPPANSDALGHDRVLLLDFSEPVRAEDVAVNIQGGLDTAG